MSKQGRGFITFAQNTSSVDYLEMAYVQALNVKGLHSDAAYAVIVDAETAGKVTDKQRAVFDHVITLPFDNAKNSEWKLANEYQVFALTPFKETIKLEADLLLTRSIEHWWPAFRLRDVFLSYGTKNYRQARSLSRANRKFFDDNELPDVYTGLMYFRYSKFANQFFSTAEKIFQDWDYLKTYVLKNCREDTPSTDVLYAITAKTLGVEQCTVPSMDFVNFVHLKNSINGWGNTDRSWKDMVMYEQDGDMIRVHNLNQYHPVHYHAKDFITTELLELYERKQ
jgi:hypothetical protein